MGHILTKIGLAVGLIGSIFLFYALFNLKNESSNKAKAAAQAASKRKPDHPFNRDMLLSSPRIRLAFVIVAIAAALEVIGTIVERFGR